MRARKLSIYPLCRGNYSQELAGRGKVEKMKDRKGSGILRTLVEGYVGAQGPKNTNVGI